MSAYVPAPPRMDDTDRGAIFGRHFHARRRSHVNWRLVNSIALGFDYPRERLHELSFYNEAPPPLRGPADGHFGQYTVDEVIPCRAGGE